MRVVLDRNGYPINPNSIFIGVKRVNVPSYESLVRSMVKGEQLAIPVKQFLGWETLVGVVTNIKHFTDGIVAHLPQSMNQSNLKWDGAVLWIPFRGSCGILN